MIIEQIIRSNDWIRFQETNLLTPEAFQDLETLNSNLRRGPEADSLDTKIAPVLKGMDHLSKFETGVCDQLTLGHWYARYGHGPGIALEKRFLRGEAGYAPNCYREMDAAVFDSGMSAIAKTIEALIEPIGRKFNSEGKLIGINMTEREGKMIVAGKTVYFMTNDIIGKSMVNFGFISSNRINTSNIDEMRQFIDENRDKIIAIYYEPLTNPLMEYTDTREVAKIAHTYGIPVIVDNTFLGFPVQQAFRLGADVVINSLTKYACGEGDIMGGIVVGPKDFIKRVKNLRSLGGILDPKKAVELYRRLESLPERMGQYARNAKELASELQKHQEIEVYYPGCIDIRDGLPGGVLSFRFNGGNNNQRQGYERRFCEEVINGGGPLVYKTSFGEQTYNVFGQSTFGWDVCEAYHGLVRLAVAPGDVKPVINQVDNLLNNIAGRR